jgi:hypothetical protein
MPDPGFSVFQGRLPAYVLPPVYVAVFVAGLPAPAVYAPSPSEIAKKAVPAASGPTNNPAIMTAVSIPRTTK